LIGSEAQLSISTNDADVLDAPWEISLSYKPPTSDDTSTARRFYPWKKTLATIGSRRELDVRASAPGEYTILGVKGKVRAITICFKTTDPSFQWCPGDVLAPETCTVVEKPKPTAEIEWKKIHEW
jgi:nucleoporin POM152